MIYIKCFILICITSGCKINHIDSNKIKKIVIYDHSKKIVCIIEDANKINTLNNYFQSFYNKKELFAKFIPNYRIEYIDINNNLIAYVRISKGKFFTFTLLVDTKQTYTYSTYYDLDLKMKELISKCSPD